MSNIKIGRSYAVSSAREQNSSTRNPANSQVWLDITRRINSKISSTRLMGEFQA